MTMSKGRDYRTVIQTWQNGYGNANRKAVKLMAIVEFGYG